ncbi:MAG: N-acetylmuramoyl-L-alanine amidase [Phycisphaeraceae bacterium]|nr:N-acetylmuramoyl-L-alanine amidase [Phycisphaeraceae bacterium]
MTMMTFHVTVLLALVVSLGACAAEPGTPLTRCGDEIMVCGRLFHTGTRVVLWTDQGGYDAYRVEKRFAPLDAPTTSPVDISGARYGLRHDSLTPDELQRVRGGGWDLPLLQRVVDQFVIHYDAVGNSRDCFEILQDKRGLSIHFMLDTDGTIYQTLDVKERAWHATIANDRSVGIEIAHVGAVPAGDPSVTSDMMRGMIQGQELAQSPFTDAQYRALAKLTAALCVVLPRIKCDYPRDANGQLVRHKLDDETLRNYHGLLGHYHIQTNKVDPGPAFDWDRLMRETKAAR